MIENQLQSYSNQRDGSEEECEDHLFGDGEAAAGCVGGQVECDGHEQITERLWERDVGEEENGGTYDEQKVDVPETLAYDDQLVVETDFQLQKNEDEQNEADRQTDY